MRKECDERDKWYVVAMKEGEKDSKRRGYSIYFNSYVGRKFAWKWTIHQ